MSRDSFFVFFAHLNPAIATTGTPGSPRLYKEIRAGFWWNWDLRGGPPKKSKYQWDEITSSKYGRKSMGLPGV